MTPQEFRNLKPGDLVSSTYNPNYNNEPMIGLVVVCEYNRGRVGLKFDIQHAGHSLDGYLDQPYGGWWIDKYWLDRVSLVNKEPFTDEEYKEFFV